jgi:hypothetical protein
MHVKKKNKKTTNVFLKLNKNNYLVFMYQMLSCVSCLKEYESYCFRMNRIGGVMVSMLASSAVDRGFEHRSGQTKDYKIGTCCFSAKHAALRKKSKYWLAWNHVYPWTVVLVS